MAEPGAEPSEAISVEDDYDSSVTRERQEKILGYLGIFRNFWGYLDIFGGSFREKIENFRIDF